MAKTTSPELAKASLVWNAFVENNSTELAEDRTAKLMEEKTILMDRIAEIDAAMSDNLSDDARESSGIAKVQGMMKLNLSERIIMEGLAEAFLSPKGTAGLPQYLAEVRGLYAAPFTGGAVPTVSDADKEKVLGVLDKEGLTVGEISKETKGMDTKLIAKCAAVLISEKKVRKSGEKRGTKYHLV